MRSKALVLGTLLVLAAPSAAARAATVSVTPNVSAAGKTVHVTGTGFRARASSGDQCARATISLAGSGGGTLGQVDTGTDGSFSADVQIPAGQAPGRYSLTASTPANGSGGAGAGCTGVTSFTSAATPFKVMPAPMPADPAPPPDPPPPPPGGFPLITSPLLALTGPQIKGECAAVLNPSNDVLLAAKNPDEMCYTGSTAKTMTLHVALQALKDGKIHSGDQVTFGQQALAQGCTCLGSYAANKDPTADGGPDNTVFEPEFYALPGETMQSLNDMLMGVVMSAAEPTVMTAEHTAEGVKNLPPATTQSEDNQHELEFIKLMNQHTSHGGAPKTTFYTEHGGDIPDDASIQLQQNGLGPPQSTARDMTHLWRHFAASDPKFVQLMGFRGTYNLFTVSPGNVVRNFSFTKGYTYYPHIDADKNGGSTGCITCIVGQATRFKRTLIYDVMQSPDDKFGQPKGYVEQDFTDGAIADAGRALHFAFSKLLAPKKRGDSAKHGGGADDASIDCRGTARCVTASIRNGALSLRSWGIDTKAKDVKRLGVWPPARTRSRPNVLDADVAYQGAITYNPPSSNQPHKAKANPSNDIAVVAVRTGPKSGRGTLKLELRSFQIASDGSPITLRHVEEVSSDERGFEPKLSRLSSRRFAMVVRRPGNHLRVTTWEVGAGGNMERLSSALGEDVKPPGLAITAADGGVFVGYRRTDGHATGTWWTVGDSGHLTGFGAFANGPIGKSPSVATSKANNGEAIYALSAVAGSDPDPKAPPAKSQIINSLLASGPLPASIKGYAAVGPFPDGASQAAIVPLGDGTVSAVVRPSGVRLSPAEGDPNFTGNYAVTAYERTGTTSAGPGKRVDLAPLGHKHGVGEVVLSKITPKGFLEVSAWRVG